MPTPEEVAAALQGLGPPKEYRPPSPFADFSLSSVARAAGRKGEEVARQIAANVEDLNQQALDAPPHPLALGPWALAKYMRARNATPPPEETSVGPAPFAQHSDDPFVKVAGMVADPMNFVGAGAVVRPVKSASQKVAEELTKALEKKLVAPKDVDVAARFKSGEREGLYRGTEAFGGITPQKATAMRGKFIADALQGAPYSKYWYDDASRDILRIAGGDPRRADMLADALAITSPSTPVGGNTNFGFKGYNQHLVGEPVRTGMYPTRMSQDIERAFAADEAGATGLKRNAFAAGLSQAWRPNPNIRGTHDIHYVGNLGIIDPLTKEPWRKGIKDAGHRFLDDMDQRIVAELNEKARLSGQPTDWTSYRAQSAAWPVARYRAGLAPSVEAASKHYGNFIDEYSALVPREYEPGRNTAHQLESFNAPESVRQAYADALESTVRGKQGIDSLASNMGALTDRTLPNLGTYEGRNTPGYTSRIAVGKATGSQELDPASQRVVEAVAGAHGLLGLQRQVATSFLGNQNTVKNFSGALINRGAPYTPAELQALSPKLSQLGLDVPQVDPRGARVLNFTDPGDPRRRAQAEFLRSLGGETRTNTGRLIPENAPEQWSSKPFIAAVEAGGPKMVEGFNKAVSGAEGIASQRLAIAEKFAKEQGWTNAPYFRPMMEALRDGGLPALKGLVEKGIVPAAAFAAIVTQLGESNSD